MREHKAQILQDTIRFLSEFNPSQKPHQIPMDDSLAQMGEGGSVRDYLHPGVWVEFNLPLFGRCTAKIHDVTLDGCIITDHSVLRGEGEPVTIPASWVRDVYREEMVS